MRGAPRVACGQDDEDRARRRALAHPDSIARPTQARPRACDRHAAAATSAAAAEPRHRKRHFYFGRRGCLITVRKLPARPSTSPTAALASAGQPPSAGRARRREARMGARRVQQRAAAQGVQAIASASATSWRRGRSRVTRSHRVGSPLSRASAAAASPSRPCVVRIPCRAARRRPSRATPRAHDPHTARHAIRNASTATSPIGGCCPRRRGRPRRRVTVLLPEVREAVGDGFVCGSTQSYSGRDREARDVDQPHSSRAIASTSPDSTTIARWTSPTSSPRRASSRRIAYITVSRQKRGRGSGRVQLNATLRRRLFADASARRAGPARRTASCTGRVASCRRIGAAGGPARLVRLARAERLRRLLLLAACGSRRALRRCLRACPRAAQAASKEAVFFTTCARTCCRSSDCGDCPHTTS